jgi:hypothetical protein
MRVSFSLRRCQTITSSIGGNGNGGPSVIIPSRQKPDRHSAMRPAFRRRCVGEGKAESLPWRGPAGKARHTGATISRWERNGKGCGCSRLTDSAPDRYRNRSRLQAWLAQRIERFVRKEAAMILRSCKSFFASVPRRHFASCRFTPL